MGRLQDMGTLENPRVGGSIRWTGSPNVAEVMDDRERPPLATIKSKLTKHRSQNASFATRSNCST